MRFINNGGPIKIRKGNFKKGFYWITIRTGEEIELDKNRGFAYGLNPVNSVTEGQIGSIKVETKQFEKLEYTPKDLFFKELIKIKGIGSKTARDIVVWGTKEKLIETIKLKGNLPFRDDIENKLKEKYGNGEFI